jgi:uncharacterized protein (TIGR00369 family)
LSKSSHRGPLEALNRLIKENRISDYSSPNLLLGMRPVAFTTGAARWRWENQPTVTLNPFGTIQGGYVTVLIDEMFSTAIASVLEDGEWAMTVEFKINFLRALNRASWDGGARVIQRTRSIAFLEAEIHDQSGATAVTATSTWSISRR